MNPSKYRADGSFVEDDFLTQTTEFSTISDTTNNIPVVDKILIDTVELPLG